MAGLVLVVGNKNYSSWSLRAWLALKVLGVPFEERRIPLYGPESKAELLKFSPVGKVPILVDGATTVWDSLAILEYLAERHPRLWPADAAARARARAISAEMHSGFPNLRHHMCMNIRKRHPGKGRTPEVLAEIRRVVEIWSAAQGPFLFGGFGAADAMYAPVVLRFRTYEVELPPPCRAYADRVLALPAMREWIADAERETETLPQFELYA
ncbi:MAG: glutathione S-transferase family protein [Burkholderiales bacterium]